MVNHTLCLLECSSVFFFCYKLLQSRYFTHILQNVVALSISKQNSIGIHYSYFTYPKSSNQQLAAYWVGIFYLRKITITIFHLSIGNKLHNFTVVAYFRYAGFINSFFRLMAEQGCNSHANVTYTNFPVCIFNLTNAAYNGRSYLQHVQCAELFSTNGTVTSKPNK